MNDSMKLMILNIVKIFLAIVGLILVVWTISSLSGTADFKDMSMAEKKELMNNSALSAMTQFVMWIVIIGAKLILLFFLFSIKLNPVSALKSVAGIILSAIAFLIFYLAAKGTMISVAVEKDIEQSVVKATEAGLYLTIFMVVVGFILMLFGGLFKYIKK
jgi:hypothetical protein